MVCITSTLCIVWVGLTLDLDAVGLQIESYLPTCVCKAAPWWCGLGCRSLKPSVVWIKLLATHLLCICLYGDSMAYIACISLIVPICMYKHACVCMVCIACMACIIHILCIGTVYFTYWKSRVVHFLHFPFIPSTYYNMTLDSIRLNSLGVPGRWGPNWLCSQLQRRQPAQKPRKWQKRDSLGSYWLPDRLAAVATIRDIPKLPQRSLQHFGGRITPAYCAIQCILICIGKHAYTYIYGPVSWLQFQLEGNDCIDMYHLYIPSNTRWIHTKSITIRAIGVKKPCI